MKSNIETWKILQEREYFETHPCYRTADGVLPVEGDDVAVIERYRALDPAMKVVVVGCGYGRETVSIAPRVAHVWGIDVSRRILDKAVAFLGERGVRNFTPVLAEQWQREIPDGIDLFYCYIVFQHLTRDLTTAYVTGLARRLAAGGSAVCQFADLDYGLDDADPDKVEEPSVRWNPEQIRDLAARAGLTVERLDTQHIAGHGRWHWVGLRRG